MLKNHGQHYKIIKKLLSRIRYSCLKGFVVDLKLSKNMKSHINGMLNAIDQLAALGEALKDKIIIALLLCSLPIL